MEEEEDEEEGRKYSEFSREGENKKEKHACCDREDLSGRRSSVLIYTLL